MHKENEGMGRAPRVVQPSRHLLLLLLCLLCPVSPKCQTLDSPSCPTEGPAPSLHPTDRLNSSLRSAPVDAGCRWLLLLTVYYLGSDFRRVPHDYFPTLQFGLAGRLQGLFLSEVTSPQLAACQGLRNILELMGRLCASPDLNRFHTVRTAGKWFDTKCL